jgi:hypothetical protein
MTASEAIQASIRENRIVTIYAEDASEELIEALAGASVDNVLNNEIHEFWGDDGEGEEEWRVHVEVPV